MRGVIMVAVTVLTATAAFAETENFDQDKPGSVPAGWACGVTGRGAPTWAVEADGSAPSAPNVLRQSGSGTFPWCVKKSVSLTDGFVEVKFKSERGREDQAGGVLWRWKNGDNYYVARGNALENNVSLYKPYIEQEDDHIGGAGAVGVWTKADSVTAFDDFSYGGPSK